MNLNSFIFGGDMNMEKWIKIIVLIVVGLLSIKLLGIVLGLIFGVVGTVLKLAIVLLVGAAVVFGIKKLILD